MGPGATRMAARRSCVNSLWSGTERVRIGERLKATLAGVLELEVLRCKHMEMVDGALEDRGAAAANAEEPGPVEESGTPESAAKPGSATSRRQQVSQRGSLHDQIIKHECGDGGHLPTSQPPPPPGSVDRFYRCLVAIGCVRRRTESDGARDHPSTQPDHFTQRELVCDALVEQMSLRSGYRCKFLACWLNALQLKVRGKEPLNGDKQDRRDTAAFLSSEQ